LKRKNKAHKNYSKITESQEVYKLNVNYQHHQTIENNPHFIKLKQTLQNIISNFTTQGLEVMKEWSLINTKLLIKDHCHNILKKINTKFIALMCS